MSFQPLSSLHPSSSQPSLLQSSSSSLPASSRLPPAHFYPILFFTSLTALLSVDVYTLSRSHIHHPPHPPHKCALKHRHKPTTTRSCDQPPRDCTFLPLIQKTALKSSTVGCGKRSVAKSNISRAHWRLKSQFSRQEKFIRTRSKSPPKTSVVSPSISSPR